MEGEFHFDATPIAPPGSEMLVHKKPNRRKSWGFNAKTAWYLGPCFQHYRSFRGILPSTGGERISDTVRFKHHAITIPQLTPADRILEAARQLQTAIKQQPKKAPMDKITAIELLREVLLWGEKNHSPTQQRPSTKAGTRSKRQDPERTSSSHFRRGPSPVRDQQVATHQRNSKDQHGATHQRHTGLRLR